MKFTLASAATALAASVSLVAAAPTNLAARQYIPQREYSDEYQANDPRITYSGNWTHLSGLDGPSPYVSYSNDPDASLSLLYGNATGLTIIAGKKADRAHFDLFLGDKFHWVGNLHGECTENCAENDADINFPLLYGHNDSETLTMSNVDGDSLVGGGPPYLAVSRLFLTRENPNYPDPPPGSPSA
ncbi:hypothetical protein JCM10207_007077 [Rhodosporidiobolus poonsookiae]